MKTNTDYSAQVVLTPLNGQAEGEPPRATLERRGNVIWMEVEDGAGHKLSFSMSLYVLLGKLTRHGADILTSPQAPGQPSGSLTAG